MGSGYSADVRVPEEKVDATQCWIEFSGQNWQLRQESRIHPTYVNGSAEAYCPKHASIPGAWNERAECLQSGQAEGRVKVSSAPIRGRLSGIFFAVRLVLVEDLRQTVARLASVTAV